MCIIYILLLLFVPSFLEAQTVNTPTEDSNPNSSFSILHASYIDPLIGSEGLGRVFVGPSCPYGMVKPGPDCGVGNNAGWAPMPAEVTGFSQLHVSGTGGGPKYGNILIKVGGRRTSEDIRLGYYSCTFDDGREVEVTTAERASFYRFKDVDSITFDLEHFLGKNPVPKAREAQQYEDSHLEHPNDSVWQGYQTISGGWNNGAPYTVFFYAKVSKSFDQPRSPLFRERETGRGERRTSGGKPYTRGTSNYQLLKIGISFVNIDKARQNLEEDIPHWDFERIYEECAQKWEQQLAKVQLAEDTPLEQKRMFYTALYHTMLMPVDRTKDNGLYDDYYAIWDTYRTSTPLITLLDPQRATEIANSLLDIYKVTGYMPDARSGNSNGRTQGGSNAEIVMADALAKGLHLDYSLALEAMLKDANISPTDDEAEGRGGLKEYNSLGYIPYGIPRAGNRTVEYSFCDWAIAQVIKKLKTTSYSSIEELYLKRSENWKNIWRSDYVHDGAKGFIMPKSSDGKWLDYVPYGHSQLQPHSFLYTPDTSYEGPWYCAWWDCYFYEASSWEYSLSIPHDVPGLIEMCGGAEAFERRLDIFFEHGYYNVANEPSFLTPMLYHWIGKPEKSESRVTQIVNDNFNASPTGLPGNDDSGAMSSWLAFHMIGLYPNAGHNYYLIHSPLVPSLSIRLDNGKHFTIRKVLSDKEECLFNGIPLTDWRITHSQLLEGGELIICTTDKGKKAKELSNTVVSNSNSLLTTSSSLGMFMPHSSLLFTYKLHGQTRRFDVDLIEKDDSLILKYGIQRNLNYWQGSFVMTPEARCHARSISYQQPVDNLHIILPDDELFAMLSFDIYSEIKEKGACTWCNTPFKLIDISDGKLHLKDTVEGAEMWVLDNPKQPLIMKMMNNPVEINWEVTHK